LTTYRIAWMPGDGIGQDVLEATRIVLDRLNFDAEYITADIGWKFWRREGDPLPARTLALLRETDCAMFGAITSKGQDIAEAEIVSELRGQGLVYRSPIVRLRQELDLYTCLRPCKAYVGNPLNYREGIDIVVFRENTEGMYIGVEYARVPDAFRSAPGMDRVPEDAAISLRAITPHSSERIAQRAFEYAQRHGRRRVTAVHKSNVLRQTGAVFMDAVRRVAAEFPDIELTAANVDAMGMWLLKNPLDYEVIVTTNLFGDIISDLSAQMVGGLGFACSANIGDTYAVFEPAHGSAPKYAGQYRVNPIAAILAAKMMLDWLGAADLGARVEKAVAAVIAEGTVRTRDLGGSASTIEMASEIADHL